MPKVEYSPKALEDLQYINDYIMTKWGQNIAQRILKKITANIRRLEQYPVSGVELGKLIDVQTDYRYIFLEKNYFFYRIENDKVQIVRVLNEHQNYIKQLFGKSSGSEADYGDDNQEDN
ncbi:type II toxin-antitoxin system RelE/ParE family toxin [Bacillaceae bacterium S4-13-58]